MIDSPRCETCGKEVGKDRDAYCAGHGLPAEHAPPDAIRILGDPILRRIAEPWAGDPGPLTSRLERIMRAAKGVGLAAPQIGESVRMAVIAVSDRFVLQMVNPRIVWRSDETATELEGCLSIPGYEVPITRPMKITVDAGSNVVTLEGIQARAAQHEIDHLDGMLILDRWLEQAAARPALAGSGPDDSELLLLEMNLARLTDELNRIPELRREDELQLAKASLDMVRALRGARGAAPEKPTNG